MTSKVTIVPEDRIQAVLLEIWRNVLRSDVVTVDDDFFEIGGDSLLATEMVLQSERRLGISIPDSLLFEASTIRRLAEKFSCAAEVEQKSVYQISENKGQCSLFFFHGDFTQGGFYLKSLARTLSPEQPLVAVAPHGVKGGKVPFSLEEMAAERLPQILGFQPQGPFRLGGHCVGGMVALETARLLLAGGHDVEMVAMIDPIWTSAGEPWPTLKRRDDAVIIDKTSTQDLPDLTMAAETQQQYGQALATYVPKPLSVPILVFSSEFDGSPWHQVSLDFKLFEMPGGHYDLVTVRSGIFAAHLREFLTSRQRTLIPEV